MSEEFKEFRKKIGKTYSGKREIVVSAKITTSLQEKIKKVMEVRQYNSMNDFIEEALMDKIARIEWTKVKAGGVKFAS